MRRDRPGQREFQDTLVHGSVRPELSIGVNADVDQSEPWSVVSALIFDYFFTLAEPRLTDFTRLADSLGCAVEDIEEQRRELLPLRPLTSPRFDGTPDQFRSFDDYWVEFGDALFSRLGVSGGGPAYAKDRRLAHEAAILYPDVPAFVGWLRDQGWRVGVLSDADSGYLHASIGASGLIFDSVLSSEDLACYKPHRACFHAACAALAVDPADTIYVGDSPLTDIEGSRRAGLRSVWLNRRGLKWPSDLKPPAVAVRTLAELPDLVERR